EPTDEVRRRIVQGALARRERSTPWARVFTGVALAGAAAAAAVAVFTAEAPAPIPMAPDAPLHVAAAGTVGDAGRYGVGAHVVDVRDGASIRFDSVDPGAFDARVLAGSAFFDVDPLEAGETFRVHTDQVQVEVVGTRFEVGADGACRTVAVAEGRVRVTAPAGIQELGVGERGRYCAAAAGAESLVREAVVLVSRGQDLERAVSLLERYRAEVVAGPL